MTEPDFPDRTTPDAPPAAEPPEVSAPDVPQIDVAEAATGLPTPLPDSGGGLGDTPATPIVALPPETVSVAEHRISPTTGEPYRVPLVWVSNVVFYLGAAAAAVALAWVWWDAIHVQRFVDAAKLLSLVDPRPGSLLSILLSIVIAIIGVCMVAAPWITAFLTFQGYRQARWWGIASVVVGGLSYFLIPIAWISPALSAVAAVLLWLPPMKSYFAVWDEFRAPDVPTLPPRSHVEYGPLERYVV